MKRATLEKLQRAAREAAIRLLFLDEAGFCGSPPVQRSWSPRGLPHAIEPNTHTRRSVLGALDFGPNKLIHASRAGTVKGADVVRFIDNLLADSDDRPTVIVLDNASIHHGTDEATRDRWLMDHQALLFYLPPYSPELNKIEIVWRHLKYRWRCFATWTKKTIDAELADLLAGYGIKYQVSFS
ncbi:transposase [Burkholderia sp. HI2714]|uniref:IS630 family transposase n=1 Tax=Burkholderia sp. HI2714 TaxID=2015359 RepID=UPI000B7A5351|nr:IS630 family transposase [Burkholderia sp. HI2714]OXJ21077.1 transposase [Burkholderia sp. HI2714]